jgi:perosamine synthetase
MSKSPTSTNYFPSHGKLFYFWKGRVALYAILKALNIGPGDEVILPGFTCVVVPNAILYLGATPIYADIEPDTYNLSAATVEPLITGRTRLILAQNTFGLSVDLDPIMALAQQHNLVVIEDCAHGLGGSYRGKHNGTVAHAAFFSSQWSKPISTGLGGVAYTQDDAIAAKIEEIMTRMPKPSLSHQGILHAQVLVRPLADNPALHYLLISTYRFLTRKLGLSVGSNSGSELNSLTMPQGYVQRMGLLQQRKWEYDLTMIDAKVKQRQKVATQYDDFFTSTGIKPPYRPDYAKHGMLRYTLRMTNRDQLLNKARKMHIPVGDWFVSPLYPIVGDLTRWGYCAGRCPVAEQACREVINLFTDKPLSRQQLAALFNSGD